MSEGYESNKVGLEVMSGFGKWGFHFGGGIGRKKDYVFRVVFFCCLDLDLMFEFKYHLKYRRWIALNCNAPYCRSSNDQEDSGSSWCCRACLGTSSVPLEGDQG